MHHYITCLAILGAFPLFEARCHWPFSSSDALEFVKVAPQVAVRERFNLGIPRRLQRPAVERIQIAPLDTREEEIDLGPSGLTRIRFNVPDRVQVASLLEPCEVPDLNTLQVRERFRVGGNNIERVQVGRPVEHVRPFNVAERLQLETLLEPNEASDLNTLQVRERFRVGGNNIESVQVGQPVVRPAMERIQVGVPRRIKVGSIFDLPVGYQVRAVGPLETVGRGVQVREEVVY